eukprot:Pgem_evm2s18548
MDASSFNKTYFQQYGQLEQTLLNLEPILNQNLEYLHGNRSDLHHYGYSQKSYKDQIDDKEIERKKDVEYLSYFRETGPSFKNVWGLQLRSNKGLRSGSWLNPRSWFYDMESAIGEIKDLQIDIDNKKQNLEEVTILYNKTSDNILNLQTFLKENDKLKDSLNAKKQAVMEHEILTDAKSLQIKKELNEYEKHAQIFDIPNDHLNLNPISNFKSDGLEKLFHDYAKIYSNLVTKDTFEGMAGVIFEEDGRTLKAIYQLPYTDEFTCMLEGGVWSNHVAQIIISRVCIQYPELYIGLHYTMKKISSVAEAMVSTLSKDLKIWETTTKVNMNSFFEKIKSERELKVIVGNYNYETLQEIIHTDFKLKTEKPKYIFSSEELQDGKLSSSGKYAVLKTNLNNEFSHKFDDINRAYNDARKHITNEYNRLCGIKQQKSSELTERKEVLFEIKRKIELAKA